MKKNPKSMEWLQEEVTEPGPYGPDSKPQDRDW